MLYILSWNAVKQVNTNFKTILALYIITNVNAPLLLYYILPMYQEYEIKIIMILIIIITIIIIIRAV